MLEAVAILEEQGGPRELALARRQLGLILTRSGRQSSGTEEMERALVSAEASGDPIVRRRVIGTLVNTLALGPAAADEIVARCEELLPTAATDRVLKATLKRMLGAAYAMVARPDEALKLIEESGRVLDEADQLTLSAMYKNVAAYARELAGDKAGAERELLARWSYFAGAESATADRRAIGSAYDLALLYCDEGRFDEAERVVGPLRDLPLGRIHAREQVAQRLAVEARLAAHYGRQAEAAELAERVVEAVETWASTGRTPRRPSGLQ